MQPMMVINSGDPFPELAIVVITGGHGATAANSRPWASPGSWPAWLYAHARSGVVAADPRLAGIAAWVLAASARSSACPRCSNGSIAALIVLACGTWDAWPPRWARSPRRSRKRSASAGGAVGAVVGEPPAAREGPRGTHHRDMARYRQGHRAYRLAGHVRHRGPVGMARPAPPGTRPDHHRCDREDSRDRIGVRHAPQRGPRLPDPR